MLWIDNKIISDEVMEEYFSCNLNACKGACCWEGDYGAPLEEEEIEILENILDKIRPFLSTEGLEEIEKNGPATWFEKAEEYGTTLINGGACAFLSIDDSGTAKCGIEKAWEEGVIDFRKPISCHLYPIRITKQKKSQLEYINYDRWDICAEACTKGLKEKMPLYLFAKDALIRKYGSDFFEQLLEAKSEM